MAELGRVFSGRNPRVKPGEVENHNKRGGGEGRQAAAHPGPSRLTKRHGAGAGLEYPCDGLQRGDTVPAPISLRPAEKVGSNRRLWAPWRLHLAWDRRL